MEDPPLFQVWSPSHWAVLAFVALLAFALIRATRGRAWDHPRVAFLRGLIGGIVLTGAIVDNTWIISNAGPEWVYALPCHLCSWVFIMSGLALLTGQRWLQAATVYWGLTLTINALVFPDLGYGFPDPVFFLFFWGHALPVVIALWLLLGLQGSQSRLPRGSWWRSLVLFELWGVITFLLWRRFDTNYGYWNERPAVPTPLDWFGPWPWYLIVAQILIALLWWGLSWLLEQPRSKRSR